MGISSKLDELHQRVRKNWWLHYFAIFNRIALAAGFIPSGLVKIFGERFTDLAVNQPMGHYLDAFYHTGYYYTFVGVMQVMAAIFLLIPRTTTLGALLYFPIILNIFVLSYSLRFDGSAFTAPLMVLANLYLLCWDYHKLRLIFPFNYTEAKQALPKEKNFSCKLPLVFSAGVVVSAFLVIIIHTQSYTILPRNSLDFCEGQCEEKDKPRACHDFCTCIHTEGRPLNECLQEYKERQNQAK